MEHVKDKKAKIEKKEMTNFEEVNAQKKDEDMKDRKSTVKKEIFGKDEPITISKVAEEIEQMVDKVINLEIEVISQATLIMRLKFENDELYEHLESLEHEKMILTEDSSNMSIKIKRVEEQLEMVQILDHKVKGQNSHLEARFDEVSTSLDSLSAELLIAKPDENIQEHVTFCDGKEENTKLPKLENDFRSYKTHPSKENVVVEENKIKDDNLGDFADKSMKKDEVNVVESPDINIEVRHHHHHQALSETTVINNDGNVDYISKPNLNQILAHEIEDRERMLLEEYTSTLKSYKQVKKRLNGVEKRNRASSFRSAVQMKMLKTSNESKDSEIRSLYEKLKLFERKMEKSDNFKVKKASNLDKEETEEVTILDETVDIEPSKTIDLDSELVKENGKELEEAANLIDERTQGEEELEEIEFELKKASDAIDEGTHRIKELIENAHSELKKAQGLVEGSGTKNKEEVGEVTKNELTKSPYMVDEGTPRTKEIDKSGVFEQKKSLDLLDETTCHELKKSSGNSFDDGTQRRKKLRDGIDEVLDIEDEIRTEIDDLRKENLELWLRFSTSYHQINRFQDSYNDLRQEIKDVKEKKHEHDSSKHHQHHHQQQHSHYVSSDVRPLYRQLHDMHTEVILWLEKSGILEDDLQHRLTSLSNIQNEISDITSEYSNVEKMTSATPLGDHQAAKFQGEVLNMKQENAKVLDELRVASKRVKTLQVDLEKTLSELDAEIGQIKKSSKSSLRVPFKSFLFGAKLRRKRRSSLFTYMSPSLRRHHSNIQQPSPQPKKDV